MSVRIAGEDGEHQPSRVFEYGFLARLEPEDAGYAAVVGAPVFVFGIHAEHLGEVLDALYTSTWTPNSTTRSGGRRKNAVARTALRAISTNSFSRHTAMPRRSVTMIVSRPRK
jgi:hypothetical protein